MGQGYSLTTLSAGTAGIDVPELSDLTYEKSLGNARFMKCIRARRDDGLVVAKVVMKPYQSLKLAKYIRALVEERRTLADIPNALGYHRILETSTNGYLIRQFIHSSLYDRMSTRPFLEGIEKRWLAFQLLCAVRECHARNIHHGDVKTENVLVTSWNWLYLSDFSSSFKPTYLPLDNPADFSFYFDNSGRRTCYLAPERFLDQGESGTGTVTWAMDIFSVGCVIAELFLESPIFSLSQLFRYKNKEYDPVHTTLSRIEDADVREMVAHMISRDPEQRYSADEYLNFWRQKCFPEYFYSFLHQYMFLVTDPSSGRADITVGKENLGESDSRIDRVYYDFDKIAYFLNYDIGQISSSDAPSKPTKQLFPLQVDIPNNSHRISVNRPSSAEDGTLIFLQLVVSSLRSTARSTARVRACELLLAFAERLTDEAKLDRVVPYLIALLQDVSDNVKVAALRSLTQVLDMVRVVSPINANIFSEYIIPRLQPLVSGHASKPAPLVRATYASCIATLASTASRYLDLVQGLRANGSLPTADPETEDGMISHSLYQNLYDQAHTDLVKQFEDQTKRLLQDTDPIVRRSFLGSVATLCVFFGSTTASDVILSHLNTYLNDRDWMLKCAFFETVVGVATYIGGPAFEEYILPLMVQALTDPEEFVVERVLRAVAAIAELGLLQRHKTWELVDVIARFMMHPNIWIREAAAHFIAASVKYLSSADRHSIILPLIRMYTRSPPSDLSELRILETLKKPLSRLLLDMTALWATRTEKGIFWQQARQQRTFSFGHEDGIPTASSKDLGPKSFAKLPKNEEDENWINRLRGVGLDHDDEFKLLVLREYIFRVAQRKLHENQDQSNPTLAGIVALHDVGITPKTILFDDDPRIFHDNELVRKQQRAAAPQTIAEAMLDASTTIDESTIRRKSSHIDRILQQEGLPARSSPMLIASPTSSSPTGYDSPALSNSPRGRPLDSRNGQQSSGALQDISRTSSLGERKAFLRHQNSAVNLLGRGESGSKAQAEIATSSTNAVGSVDGTFNRTVGPRKTSASTATIRHGERQSVQQPAEYRPPHDYTGTDPTILNLLDSLYMEHYPSEYIDFGPQVAPLKGRNSIKRNGGVAGPWTPEGTLVAMLSEHTGSVNRVVVSPDHAFFITGSDDGTVKVWDSRRLERNITHKSRQTHRHAEGAKVTSLNFIENNLSFVSCADDGAVQVVRVQYDTTEAENISLKYRTLRVVRDYRLKPGQYAIWSEHYKSEDAKSMLVLATNDSHIIAIDLRSMSVVFDVQNPVTHGIPTTFCIDRKHQWLLLGTTHGVIDLWDLRFLVRLKAWGFTGGAPIHRIMFTPVRRTSRKTDILVAGGTGQGEITLWDLRASSCRDVYRTGAASATEGSKSYTLIDIDEDKAGGMLERFATSRFESSRSGSKTGPDQGVRAVATGVHAREDGIEARNWFMISSGPDWKVRFWDTNRPDLSCIVSGLQVDERPSYSLAKDKVPGIDIIQEHLHHSVNPRQPPSTKNLDGTPKKPGSKIPSRSTVVSTQTQNLLKSSLDTIMDVALLELPYGMVISADRAGVVYVFA